MSEVTNQITLKRKKKVALVGCSNSRVLTPWNDPDMDFVGVNNLFLSEPERPWTYWYEIHYITKDIQGNFYRRLKPDFRGQSVNDYVKALNKLSEKVPVLMQQTWPEIKNSVRYPIEDVIKTFGNYFTNTISYEMALAIMMGYEEIHLYGIDMAVSSPIFLMDEYSHQRPSCEYFIGLAVGKGIKVVIPDTSDLCKVRFMYAYHEPQATAWHKKTEDTLRAINTQKQKANNAVEENKQKLLMAMGAEQMLKEMTKTWDTNSGLNEK